MEQRARFACENNCPNHGEFERNLNDVRNDHYKFKEEQIARNESCDLQIAYNGKEIAEQKKLRNHCKANTIPKIKAEIVNMSLKFNKLIGTTVFVGLILSFVLAWNVRLDAKVTESKDQTNELKTRVAEVKRDIQYLKNNQTRLMDLMQKVYDEVQKKGKK